MTDLEVPSLLNGPWKHAVFVTFGADLQFFENMVLRQLRDTCRNRLILADGRRYLDACGRYAGRRIVRHLNHRYVVEGVFVRGAAHAKLVLLTNESSGILLVGSGNMGLQGYASGGELFTRYDFNADHPEQLNAFLAVRDLLTTIFDRDWAIGAQARAHVDHMLEQVPWLARAPVGDAWPVRSNLDRSFLTQLQDAVAGRSVIELTAMAPFYDPEAHAVNHLIDAFRPERIRLLVQRGQTSVRPERLQAIMDRLGTRCEVLPIERRLDVGDRGPYLHAKFVLLRLPDSVVCLQGSPNLSVAALLQTPPHGNIELANLLQGEPDAFDDVLDALAVFEPVTTAVSLDVHYDVDADVSPADEQSWHLLGGEWNGDRLIVSFGGQLPSLAGASLRIGEVHFPILEPHVVAATLKLRLAEDAQAALAHVCPVAIAWQNDNGPEITNPIYPCHIAALNSELAREAGAEYLGRFGDLDLDDADLMKLLVELESALVLDRRSAWQLAGRDLPPQPEGSDDAPPLDWGSVDLDAVRHHPKLRQYLVALDSGSRPSRLQMILDAIGRHFNGLIERHRSSLMAGVAINPPDGYLESEEAAEARSVERESDVMAAETRTRNSLMRFVRRYLNGVQSPDFQRVGGPDLLAVNYVIFMHLLCRLGTRRYLLQSDAVHAMLDAWEILLTGRRHLPAYFQTLVDEEENRIRELLKGKHGAEITLVALWFVADWGRRHPELSLRIRARNAVRKLLCHPLLAYPTDALELAWLTAKDWSPTYAVRPQDVVKDIAELARLESRAGLLHWLEKRYRLQPNRVRFDRHKVFGDSGRPILVDCLRVDAPDALATLEDATAILRAWMRVEQLPYYRAYKPAANSPTYEERAIFFDTEMDEGRFLLKDGGDIICNDTVHSIRPARTPWDRPLDRLESSAALIDERSEFRL